MNRTKWIVLVMAGIFLYGCGSKSDDSSQSSGTVAMTGSPQSSKKTKALIKQGVDHLNRKDVAKAVASFNQAIAESPNDPEPLLVLGDVYMHLNNISGAIKSFEGAAALQPDNGQTFYLLGVCYGLSGDRATAQKALERSALIFRQKQDEAGFKRSVITLQQMMQAAETQSVSSTLQGNKMTDK